MEHGARKPTQAQLEVSLPQPSELLQPFIFRPTVRRDLEGPLLDVHKAHLLVDLLQIPRHHHGTSDVLAGDAHVPHPARHGAVGRHGAVVAKDGGVELVGLKVPARVQVFEGLLSDLRFER